MEIVKKAGELLCKSSEVTLASVSENGYPRVCVLSKIKSEGVRKFWVATGSVSRKVSHFKENPKAGACFYSGGNSVTLVGKVSIIQDPAVKAEMWLDWFIEHFPGGIDDPNYCVLCFETEEATLWMDCEFVTLRGEEL